VIIDQAVYNAMVEHMRQAAPHEGCGLLAGPRKVGNPAASETVCDWWMPMVNVAEFPRLRYEMDDAELLAAWQTLDDAGRRPWIVCHSHPCGEAVPSVHDVRLAVDRTLRHAVVSLASSTPVVTLWELNPFDPARPMRKEPYHVRDLGFRTTGTSDLTHDVSSG